MYIQDQINIDNQDIRQIKKNYINQPTQLSEKIKKNYLFFGIIFLICFLIFGLGSYYLESIHIIRKNSPNKILPKFAIKNEISPFKTATNKKNINVNLNIYKNNQYGFSFAYPQNYIITTNSNCSSLINNQVGCLLSLTLNPPNSDYLPKAYFWLIKGINSVNISGQVSNINFDSQKKVWVLKNSFSSEEVISIWDYTKSGQEIIKSSNGGSHGSSYYYIIPNYKNDEVAIFSIPQSYRLRCDNFINDKSKETNCNNFYKSVINQYNKGKTIFDTWLPENYLNFVYSEAENIVKSYTKNTE